MPLLEPNLAPEPRELRRFAALLFPVFLLVVSALVWWSTGRLQPAAGIAVAAVVVSAAGLLSQKLARVLYVVWIYAVFPIGWTISHLVMVITYYGVVAPLGLAMRLVGRDALRLRKPEVDTYWERWEQPEDVRYYTRQF